MKLLYTDDSLLVIDKPAGLPVLPDGWEPDAPFLVRQLEEEFGKIWVVHRLDKITSGAMVFARTAEAHRSLSIQFEKHEAKKIYHAITVGAPPWATHTAKHKLRVNVGHKHRSMVEDGPEGKPSLTKFTVLERRTGYGLVEAAPLTGRTHQVRVHASALGYPLLADTLYGAPPTDLIARPALHALSLSFTHPDTGKRVIFEAPYAEDFAAALTKLA
jgi:RluA family pseudouridine synthase